MLVGFLMYFCQAFMQMYLYQRKEYCLGWSLFSSGNWCMIHQQRFLLPIYFRKFNSFLFLIAESYTTHSKEMILLSLKDTFDCYIILYFLFSVYLRRFCSKHTLKIVAESSKQNKCRCRPESPSNSSTFLLHRGLYDYFLYKTCFSDFRTSYFLWLTIY